MKIVEDFKFKVHKSKTTEDGRPREVLILRDDASTTTTTTASLFPLGVILNGFAYSFSWSIINHIYGQIINL